MRQTLLFLYLLLPLSLFAQVSVRVQAPSEVVEGDRFRISYVVNTSDIDDFQVADFEGIDLLYGPARSQSSSFSMVNGRTTSSSTVTFTYTVAASKTGTVRIPVATVVSGGNTYKSGSPSITVLPGGSSARSHVQGGAQSQGGSQSQGSHASAADRSARQSAGSDRITSKDLFIAVTASKKRVFEQEAVLLTYKLYFLVDVTEMSGGIPELDGFHIQELNPNRQPEVKLEHFNGRNYKAAVWKQYVVFPQMTGRLTIPEIKFVANVVVMNPNIDPFDAFFGGGSLTSQVKKTVMAPAVVLQVDPLPTPKPDNFSRAVGKFSVASTLTPLELNANDATTMRLTVTGTGNLKLMKAPEVAWPKDFERYDPKAEDKTRIGANGSSGSMIFDYIAVPRHQGQYEVPAVELCYFDPDAREYKTARTESYTMAVAKGKGGGTSSHMNLTKEEVELLGSDIRFIKTGRAYFQSVDTDFFGSSRYWQTYAAAFLVFLLLVAIFHRHAVSSADLVRQRGRKANKAATRRLKMARKLMAQNNSTAFYEETMKALWGYVADKLNIAVSELTKDNVRQRLSERGVSEELTTQFLQALDECEFARFAPGDPAATMDKIYASAEEVINRMDSELKKK